MSEMIVGGVIWIACFIGGMGIGNGYKKRKDFFLVLLDFDRYLNSCVTNLKLPITTVIDQFVGERNGAEQAFFSAVRLSFEQGDKGVLEQCVARSPLFKKDKNTVVLYFSDIGKTGFEAQIALLKHHSAMLDAACKKAEKEYKSNGKLCYKLGFLLGMAIMILVV